MGVWEFAMGVYHRRLLWSLPWVYVGVYTGLYRGVSLFVLGYHWLTIATIDLVGDNREFEV